MPPPSSQADAAPSTASGFRPDPGPSGCPQAPAVRDKLLANGHALQPGTPEEWPAYLAPESAKWGDVIRARGITLE